MSCSLESHLLRRVYANIAIRNDESDELVTNLAVAYHQKGIQIGIGPMVKVCHNQTILSPQDVVSNYSCWGRGRQNKEERSVLYILTVVEQWMARYEAMQKGRTETMARMRNLAYGRYDFLQSVGLLTEKRVRIDTRGENCAGENYPLTQTQINRVVARMMNDDFDSEDYSFWHAYQQMNQELKPGTADIPQILPQGLALITMLRDQMDGNIGLKGYQKT